MLNCGHVLPCLTLVMCSFLCYFQAVTVISDCGAPKLWTPRTPIYGCGARKLGAPLYYLGVRTPKLGVRSLIYVYAPLIYGLRTLI